MKKILAIETSCDETAVALVECGGGESGGSFKVLADQTISQAELHDEYGGVYPNLAKREHLKNLPIILSKIFKKEKRNEVIQLTPNEQWVFEKIFGRDIGESGEIVKFFEQFGRPDIDHIAVTTGPGLEPALWTGVNIARAIGMIWDIPVMPVNHMTGHIASCMVANVGDNIFEKEGVNLPMIVLLISGGHTEFVKTEDGKNFERLGITLDDAVGECFDKTARLLGLSYPGGPEIARLAAMCDDIRSRFKLPRPMIDRRNADFSFSGLKTAVKYLVRDLGDICESDKFAIATEFQNAVVETLARKTEFVLKNYNPMSFGIAGGVAANASIRESLRKTADQYGIMFMQPAVDLSTDNAMMIAFTSEIFPGKIYGREEVLKIYADGNWEVDGR